MTGEKEGSGEYALKVAENTTKYVKDLLEENAKLRARVRHLEGKVGALEVESKKQLEQFVHVEMQNSNVANLYVASFRLHGTLQRAEVLAAIREIVINLIGSEELGVFEVDAGGDLLLVTSFGLDDEQWQRVPAGRGLLGRAAQSTTSWVAADGGDRSGAIPEEEHLSVVIPLALDGKVTGAIAIFRMLGHKRALEDVDRELFNLLARQAASALYATAMYAKLEAAGLA